MAGTQVALMLGVNRRDPTLQSCAEADAKSLGAFLRDKLQFRVYERTGDSVTERAVQELISQAGRERPNRLILYYAGPASASQGKLYIAGDGPTDAKDPKNAGIDLQGVVKFACEHVGADEVLLIVDAPRQNVADSTWGTSSWEPELLAGQAHRAAGSSSQRALAIFGCATGEVCWETTEGRRGGLFTSALLQTLSKNLAVMDVEVLLRHITEETKLLRDVLQAPSSQTPVLVQLSSDVRSTEARAPVPPIGEVNESPSPRFRMSKQLPLIIGACLVTIAILAILLAPSRNNQTDTTKASQTIIEQRLPPSQAPKPVIRSFTVAPAAITQGAHATLAWLVSDAAAVSIDPEIGGVDNSGSRQVSPAINTVYQLVATGPGGTVTTSATVLVEQRPQPVAKSETQPPKRISTTTTVDVRAEENVTPHYTLSVFTNERIVAGAKVSLSDPQLKNLGFAILYQGPQPPPHHSIRVEWWFKSSGGSTARRISPYSFREGDKRFTVPQKYNNDLDETGVFEVKLLVDGEVYDSLTFEII
jgi:hypothetical protein